MWIGILMGFLEVVVPFGLLLLLPLIAVAKEEIITSEVIERADRFEPDAIRKYFE